MFRLFIAAAAALAPAQQDSVQAERDWDVTRDRGRGLIVAYTVFPDANLGISVRCQRGAYMATVAGLPPAQAGSESRELRVAFDGETPTPRRWNVAVDPSVAVSELPAPFARKLREGGRLTLVVPNAAEGGRNLRYELTLPPSNAAIDETLTACKRPLVDPRDAEIVDLPETGLPAGLSWLTRPRPEWPGGPYARGFAVASCLTRPDGALRDCVVETEHPHDGGFGDAVLSGTRRARVDMSSIPEGQPTTRRIIYRVNFVMDGYQTAEDRRRGREAREQQRQEREARQQRRER